MSNQRGSGPGGGLGVVVIREVLNLEGDWEVVVLREVLVLEGDWEL